MTTLLHVALHAWFLVSLYGVGPSVVQQIERVVNARTESVSRVPIGAAKGVSTDTAMLLARRYQRALRRCYTREMRDDPDFPELRWFRFKAVIVRGAIADVVLDVPDPTEAARTFAACYRWSLIGSEGFPYTKDPKEIGWYYTH